MLLCVFNRLLNLNFAVVTTKIFRYFSSQSFRRVLCKFGQFILELNMEQLLNERIIAAEIMDKHCPNLTSLGLFYKTISCNTENPLFTRWRI